jgi:eukaryotic-like serine/threonine-protein kinase
MSHTRLWHLSRHLCALFCLLLLLSACGQLSGNRSAVTPTPAPTATAPTLTTSTSKNSPSCTQSAFVSPLPASTHPTLVYVTQQGDSSLLQRYDVTTGSRQTLLKTQPDEIIQKANISPDGHWIVFLSLFQGQTAIQMIGVNGQQLQTLYCAPAQATIDDALLSPDARTLAFNQETQEGISMLYLLDVATGELRTVLSPLQPNFPDFTQATIQTTFLSEHALASVNRSTIGNHTIQLLNPLASKQYLIYIPMKWATNTSLYVYGTVGGSGAVVHQLALLLDTRKDVTQQGSNLQSIATTGQNFDCQDEDVTPDNRQLVCSASLITGPTSLPTVIETWSMAGGTRHVVYQGLTRQSISARAISNSTLLFLLIQANGLPALWRINTDGSGKAQLMVAQTHDADLEFAFSSYLPWSISSRDGAYYALSMENITSNTSVLLVGSLNGGQSKTIASSTVLLQFPGSAALLQIAGWA